ncbi:hypothetical protein [Haloferax sp. YSSS75]|uniref:hypothetical protein n=1 Tax=Haloferax sp. YSSS75 TaxID=3388564 RepID=UPI00398D41B3
MACRSAGWKAEGILPSPRLLFYRPLSEALGTVTCCLLRLLVVGPDAERGDEAVQRFSDSIVAASEQRTV